VQQALIYLDRDSSLSLQTQVRQRIVDGIASGAFPPGMRLPSSRKLARQLDVSRNTVVAAYEKLIADGYVLSRQRSGLFVADSREERFPDHTGAEPDSQSDLLVWRNRIQAIPAHRSQAHEYPDWNRFQYPFIDGKFDASLFPLSEWREASRHALSVADVEQWSAGSGDADDERLIEQIRTKFLTRRGIHARPEQILITLGTQNSLYIVSQLLAGEGTRVAIEDPGNFRMRELVEERGATLEPIPVDADGLVAGAGLAGCDWIYTTPSHQIPTAVAMTERRRRELIATARKHDFLIVEDDYECEINYLDRPLPALRSLDHDDRVIYVAELSKVLAPGIRLGFIVANEAVIRRARDLRRAMFNHPPRNNQRAAAFLLSTGDYEAVLRRLSRDLYERRLVLRDALSNMRGVPLQISPEVGGTTYWVKAPRRFNVGYFIEEAAKHGILLEPVEHYYSDAARAENCFRMGVTSIPEERIVPGVRRLVELIRYLVRDQVEKLDTAAGSWLRGDELLRVMSGATVYYREVYGTVCTIRLHADGTMTGDMDDAHGDRDSGTWWVDGDRFFRRWQRWNYAAEAGYYIVLDGDEIKYFNQDRQVVDAARIRLAAPSSA